MPITLDQKRARFAWNCAERNVRQHGKDYINLAKAAPALIMSNGLMAGLAFYQSRGKDYADALLNDILGWLGCVATEREDAPVLPYQAAMQTFFQADTQTYLRATNETLAMLKWLRQFADAINKGGA